VRYRVCLRAVGLFDMRCAGCNIWFRSSGWAAASQLVFLKANRQQATPAAAVRDSCGEQAADSCAHGISAGYSLLMLFIALFDQESQPHQSMVLRSAGAAADSPTLDQSPNQFLGEQ
jgi:hypothetical protein